MLNKFFRKTSSVLLVCCITALSTKAQAPADTLKITIKQAEDRFLKNNLQLIAQRYNIDNASAQIITARLFQNPDFNFNNGIYASDVSQGPAYKEQSFSVSQLFYTAGKRNKNIQLAKIGVEQAKFQFFDLIRTLKYTLRTDFYSIYYQQQSAKVYDEEINSLAKTLTVYKEEYAKGYIAQKEVLRIQAQLYSLQAEYTGLITGIDTIESEFKILIKAPVGTTVEPVVTDDIITKNTVNSVLYKQLVDSAYSNRYDLRNAKMAIDYNNMNLQLQKATAVPDVSFSINYDRLGGYGNNFLGAGVEFNLPFWNHNQGGIKQARIAIDQSKVQFQNQQNQVESDVATGYKNAVRVEKLYNGFDPQFKTDFTKLIHEVLINYQKRNLGLLEFLDYYDSYKTNVVQLNSILLNRITALEQLNYVTGTPFFNQQ
ncbi:cobalt-zinc-cadmium efflux system outer membrane protein [Mucilaginibacter frigoritolerans]|uniref:Cobalt-zinc-cadmium efflux system outer membrane protein n=1 Tax=Mucilaginibacter frigoritolerans TaxID=652788 RepID=A0A562TQR8_9SPHI|nr:TolC family protein [Mucilaginibacter frigoritolerans]TWI95937.1 cobalt-zinc-cadmium efflux system outer membrane protein [Mucilaginibacter frigoritolerans]